MRLERDQLTRNIEEASIKHLKKMMYNFRVNNLMQQQEQLKAYI